MRWRCGKCGGFVSAGTVKAAPRRDVGIAECRRCNEWRSAQPVRPWPRGYRQARLIGLPWRRRKDTTG